MAKINKYWGFVAIGALTAAAAGAVAAVIAKRNSRNEEFEFEDDFDEDFDIPVESEEEKEYQTLWQKYFDHIAIKERKNSNCQRNFMPLRYRKHLTECQMR